MKKDSEFERPNNRLNAEFELVKMGNGMTGLIISDPYASKFHIQFSMNHGYFIDTVQGISHFGEHMVFQGSQNYDSLYPFFNAFFGIKDCDLNAFTSGSFQSYYVSLPFNFEYEKAMDMLTDAFRYPLYSPDKIIKEIQAVNHEFYDSYKSLSIREDIIRQLSNRKTSFYGMGCGNNETLKPNESDSLSKKLKGYHMIVKNPNEIFFTLYSNRTINESEEMAKAYLNYQMHNFTNDEIDPQDKEKLENNIKNIKTIEIFDDNLYKHGFYFNTYKNYNILFIYYYMKKIDYKELKFDIVDYINYLLRSESLLKILREKKYIITDEIIASRSNYLDNNEFFYILIALSDEGLKNINEVIIIINKYISLIKENGSDKKYYDDFTKYMNNKDVLRFTKKQFFKDNFILQIFNNYINFGYDNILLSGKLSEEDYDENILKKYLNQIDYNKSFYGVNAMTKIKELDYNNILDDKTDEILNYYKTDFVLGKIPDDISNKINDNNEKIENLSLRETSPYFSSDYNKTVIPCYKEIVNECKTKNEFDLYNDTKYKGTKLDEENEHYETNYQIDKSSESHLVYSNIEFILDIDLNGYNSLYIYIEKVYIDYILSEISEIKETINIEFDLEKKVLDFTFKTFSDNTEKIINRFINLTTEIPSEDNFNFSKLSLISSLYAQNVTDFDNYVLKIAKEITSGKKGTNIMDLISLIETIQYVEFKNFHEKFLKSIVQIYFDIAGNIDENLVKNIHNHIKNKINISNKLLFKQPVLKDESSPFVHNYYKKSTIDFPENGIAVLYKIPEKLQKYVIIFKACFLNLAFNYLRFNYTNVYSPHLYIQEGYFIIYEQGLYKEVDSMEDDINSVLLDVIEGRITISNYKEIIESYTREFEVKEEKNLDNLFEDFISDDNSDETDSDIEIPQNFEELVNKVAPIFKEPQRTTLLIARNTMSDEDFKIMFERNKEKKSSYILNTTINITYNITDDY